MYCPECDKQGFHKQKVSVIFALSESDFRMIFTDNMNKMMVDVDEQVEQMRRCTVSDIVYCEAGRGHGFLKLNEVHA